MSDFWLGFFIGYTIAMIVGFIVEYICIKTGVSSIDTWMEKDK